MDWNARIRATLSAASHAPDTDVVEELAQHAQATYEAARAEGCPPDEAERRVADQIDRWCGEAGTLRRRPRRRPAFEAPAAESSSSLGGLLQDVRYASRLFWQQRRFAFLIIATMALGIGATTTLFAVTYGVLMKPLPWPDADRLVVLKETRGGNAPRFGSFSSAAYHSWRERMTTVEEIGAWSPRTFTLTGEGDPERVRMTGASASLLRTLGARPMIGSLFDETDEGKPVVLLSEGLWQRRFGRDPHVLGRVVRLDGEPRTVLGVVPDRMAYPDARSQGWVPFRVPLPDGNLLSMFEALAKLRPGGTVDQAAAEGTARGRFAANTGMTTMAIFGGDGPVMVSAQPVRDALTGDVRRPLIVLLVAVVLLLAIATSNIAGLQLARATTRHREFAIRAALGASSRRMIRQLVIESLLLGGAGAVAGLAVAWALHRGGMAVLPADFPRASDLQFDAGVILFAVAASGAVSLIFGLLPALRVRRLDLVGSLAADGVSAAGVGSRSGVARSRQLIITVQVAVACVLLVGASLLGRSFVELLHADRGYDPGRVLIAAIPMSGPGYTPERRTQTVQEIVSRVETLPGAAGAAFTSEAPLTPGGSTSSLTLRSRDVARGTTRVQASPRLVSPAYFSVLGLRILQGRSLEPSDTETSQPVVVVNETFARRYLGGDALGAKVPNGVWGAAQEGEAAIVGVVEDVRYVGASVLTLPEMYFSSRQLKGGMRSSTVTLLVAANGEPGTLAAAVGAIVRQADPAVVSGPVMTLEDRLLSTSLARPRLYALLLGSFAVVALLVTGVGLFGVLSYTVAQRTRELGIRAALGARRGDLVAVVVGQGMRIALVGLVAGLVVAAWSSRFIATLLYGVTVDDRLTYAAVPAVLLAVALVACLAPARRAARLDPLRAIRSA